MIEPRQTQTQTQSVTLDDEPIIDVAAAANFLGYVRRSMGRRRRLLFVTFLCTFGAVALVATIMPRSYKISMRILTHKAQVMQALVHPERSIPPSADTPTAGAIELIRSRENLENLMEDVKIQQITMAKRGVVGRFIDDTLGQVFGQPSANDLHEAMLKMLQDKLTATVDNDVVTMDIEWTDPDVAMALAQGAIARFLKMRHDMELSEISDTVTILGRNVESSRVGIEQVVQRMQKVFNEKEADLAVRSGQMTREQARRTRSQKKSHFIAIRRPVSASQVDEGHAAGGDEGERAVTQKRATLAQMKRGYEVRLKRAQEEYQNLIASLGAGHPDVMEAKRVLAGLSSQPPELLALQADLDRLQAQVTREPGEKGRPKVEIKAERAEADDAYDVTRVPVSDELYKEFDKDPEIAQILDELKRRQDQHEALASHLAAARIESETANVAFDYRYKLTVPPVYPKHPVKPNVAIMLGGGAVAALVFGIALAVLADVLSRRVLEAWQIERFLRLKVLGEVDDL